MATSVHKSINTVLQEWVFNYCGHRDISRFTSILPAALFQCADQCVAGAVRGWPAPAWVRHVRRTSAEPFADLRPCWASPALVAAFYQRLSHWTPRSSEHRSSMTSSAWRHYPSHARERWLSWRPHSWWQFRHLDSALLLLLLLLLLPSLLPLASSWLCALLKTVYYSENLRNTTTAPPRQFRLQGLMREH